jgi:hypothetical protein
MCKKSSTCRIAGVLLIRHYTQDLQNHTHMKKEEEEGRRREKYKQTSHIKRFPSKSISKSKHKRKTRVSFYIKSVGFNKSYKLDFTSRI